MKRVYVFILILSALQACGRRALPTSPDRWAPKISGVIALDRNHVDCVFSEKMSRETFVRASQFTIFSALTGETVTVIASVLGQDEITVHLTTYAMDTIEYILTCDSATDISGNYIRPVEKTFKGSSAQDTSPPVLVSVFPMVFNLEGGLDSSVVVSFSEPIDTALAIDKIFNGALFEPELDIEFSTDFTQIKITFAQAGDSLSSLKKLYSYVLSGFTDIAGNRMRGIGNFRIARGTKGLSKNIYFSLEDTLFEGYVAVLNDSSDVVDIVSCEKGKCSVPFLERGSYTAVAFSTVSETLSVAGASLFQTDSTAPEFLVELNYYRAYSLPDGAKLFIENVVK
ncbi:hypothetical protein JXA84_05540 [candidate division WOR-3 bacterium]|nr:hypothetical protein [candidate division WOR-3 bacterium]